MNTSTPPSIRPVTLGLTPSFGFGDRLGFATPGHLAALSQAGGPIKGIFAQQSIREMQRTARTPSQVMSAATQAVAKTSNPASLVWGADADHLKTSADVDLTAEAGFAFFTIDPSDHVDQDADSYDAATLEAKYQPTAWVETYREESISIPEGSTITLDDITLKRAAVKYGLAITHALKLAAHIKHAAEQRGLPYEIEVSVDETDQPTSIAEHYIIADQLRRGNDEYPGLGSRLVSLAPRFVGELEKGIDYIGDVDALETSLREHAAVAEHLGPYKLSLHSGSDKLSMYPALARATRGRFHVKTAGTSYLEAVRAVAHHAPELFRRVVDFSRGCYGVDRATYHVHAEVTDVPAPADVSDDHELVDLYLEHWADVTPGEGFTKPGRQILHCAFGSVMTDEGLGPEVRQVLCEHPDTYREILAEHFVRHLESLNSA
ncbi:MAG: tagaturonate epimerase family protein [Planctomycetota bacterium]